ncbi:DUF6691 family protein [Rhodobacter lacus]|uniref:DUF6691 family protein n=1 Tax=Rhodobacter lacus TaxID=1641972 RepID=A0ABW5A9B0_9RHOB
MRRVIWTLSGALFGLGLWLSGMTEPGKVQGWFDLAGAWDPTLGFVFAGAMIPMLIAWRIAARMPRALTGGPLPAPPEKGIDARLGLGSALFGFGWALAGLCPGPAIASLGWSGLAGASFTAAMLVGMGLWHFLAARHSPALA